MPLLLHFRCHKPVQISDFRTGTRLSYAQTSQAADSEKNIQSGLLFTKLQQVVTHWNVILFQLVYSLTIYKLVCLYMKLQLEL
jgi:hypothetical protein